MTEHTNTPELRFPEFEYEWVQKKIDNLTTKIGSGKTPKGGSANYLSEGIPFFRSQNIQNGYLNLNDLVYIDSEIDESMKNSKSYFGDILLNITGASIGRSAINTLSKTHINMNQHVCIIRLKKEFSFNFLGQFLLSPQGQKKIFKAQSGGSREGLNFKEIGSIKVNIPKNFNEQEKIGDFFSKLDHQIDLEEKKLELLEQQKRGYMQKIFSQELRFKDENGNDYPEWETRSLNKLCEINPKADNLPNQFLYIDLESVNNGKVEQKKEINIINAPSRAQRLAKKYDIFYQTVRPYQKNNFINLSNRNDIVVSTGYAQLRPLVQFYYLYSLLLTDSFVNKVLVKCTGTNYPAINSTDLSLIQILSSSVFEEQEKIGCFFRKIDQLIEKQSDKIELLKERKKGFLQKMFV